MITEIKQYVSSIVISGNNVFVGTFLGLYFSNNSGNSWSLIGQFANSSISHLAIKGNTLFVSSGTEIYKTSIQ
ncbi:MAG: hypothetical protein QM734_15230 [Cyclobacteriaceae bacterium]